MTDKQFGPIISGDEIKAELRLRSSNLEFKIVRASKMSLVLEKVAIEEKEGWIKYKPNKKSYKLSKPKQLDEQLEDKLWCIVAKMGFSELSSGRKFLIETKLDPNPRQIDIFAKDDETALVIECTQCEKPTKSSKSRVNDLIVKVSEFKDRISNSITEHYGKEKNIKPKFVIATNNIEWGEADIEKCKEKGICILTEAEIDYYRDLTTHLKSAARYQFLAHLFAGAEIPGLSKEVPATRGSMGGVNFYNFLIEPEELLKISYVGHKASRSIESLETYQRMLQPRRLKEIASYINEGGKFPTNIVINIKTPRNRDLVFETQSPKGASAFGTLKLPKHYGSAWVIDGQHRLYGYAYKNIQPGPKNDKTVLPVLAFENLPAKDEMIMFIDINSKQVKVKTSLLIELYADLHWNSPDPEERLLALQARIVSQLNNLKTSPIFGRVVVIGKGKTTSRCLTQTTLSDGLEVSRLLGSVKNGVFSPGPISDNNPDLNYSLKKASAILSSSLQMFADALPGHWEAGDKKGVGYLCTNIGIRSIILVIADICNHVRFQTKADLSTWSKEAVIDEIKKYIQPVVDYFKDATLDQIKSFRETGSSLAGVKKQSMGMNVFINKTYPDYSPDGLDAYITGRDQKGNDDTILKITNIQKRIFQHVVETLKQKFGKEGDNWWVKGIPASARQKCSAKWENENRQDPCESYLYLIDYQDIATLNWEIFCQSFSLGEKDTGNPKKCVKWINELNDIRNKTHHPEKGKLTPEQVRYVDSVFQKVTQFFPDHANSLILSSR